MQQCLQQGVSESVHIPDAAVTVNTHTHTHTTLRLTHNHITAACTAVYSEAAKRLRSITYPRSPIKTFLSKTMPGEQGIPMMKKWEATSKLEFSNPVAVSGDADAGRGTVPLSSGFKIESYWPLLGAESKPNTDKILSVIEL